jgi:hypothetical protein
MKNNLTQKSLNERLELFLKFDSLATLALNSIPLDLLLFLTAFQNETVIEINHLFYTLTILNNLMILTGLLIQFSSNYLLKISIYIKDENSKYGNLFVYIIAFASILSFILEFLTRIGSYLNFWKGLLVILILLGFSLPFAKKHINELKKTFAELNIDSSKFFKQNQEGTSLVFGLAILAARFNLFIVSFYWIYYGSWLNYLLALLSFVVFYQHFKKSVEFSTSKESIRQQAKLISSKRLPRKAI